MMCWDFSYMVRDKVEEITTTADLKSLCKKLDIPVPENLPPGENTCLCPLTEKEKREIIGALVVYHLDRFEEITIWGG